MAIFNNIDEALRRIRIKLYPKPKVESAYITRMDNKVGITFEQVCAVRKNRGEFTGSYDDLVDLIKQFFDEAAYQRCDRFAVNAERLRRVYVSTKTRCVSPPRLGV